MSNARSWRKKIKDPARWAIKSTAFFYAFIFAGIICLDQISKVWISSHCNLGDSKQLLFPWLYITYHTNTGAAFGFLSDYSLFLTLCSVFFIIILMSWFLLQKFWRSNVNLRDLGLLLILSGAIGNAIDRVRLGHVIDFIDVKFWPIFNVADSSITVGAALIIIYSTLCHQK